MKKYRNKIEEAWGGYQNPPRLLLFQCSLSMLVDVSSMSYREGKYDELIVLDFTNEAIVSDSVSPLTTSICS